MHCPTTPLSTKVGLYKGKSLPHYGEFNDHPISTQRFFIVAFHATYANPHIKTEANGGGLIH